MRKSADARQGSIECIPTHLSLPGLFFFFSLLGNHPLPPEPISLKVALIMVAIPYTPYGVKVLRTMKYHHH